MLNERQKQIKRLQQNLSSIRKIAGWTAEVLGEKIGVTKQTISNLENGKTPMNFSQYIAIRSVLDLEIENNKTNEILPQVVTILLDKGDELDDENYSKVKVAADTVAASVASGIPYETLIPIFGGLIASAVALLIFDKSISVNSYRWLKRLIK